MSAKRGPIISDADFRRMWFDRTLTVTQIGEQLGISQSAVTARARIRGMPNRHMLDLNRPKYGITCPLFAAMWQAGVGSAEIEKHYGTASKTVRNTRKRLGLQPRGRGWLPKMTLAEFFSVWLQMALAQRACLEQSALINAEMVDGVRYGAQRSQHAFSSARAA